MMALLSLKGGYTQFKTHPATNDLTLRLEALADCVARMWHIEEYHHSLNSSAVSNTLNIALRLPSAIILALPCALFSAWRGRHRRQARPSRQKYIAPHGPSSTIASVTYTFAQNGYVTPNISKGLGNLAHHSRSLAKGLPFFRQPRVQRHTRPGTALAILWRNSLRSFFIL